MNRIIVSTKDYPDQPAPGRNTPPATIDNIRFLLEKHGISSRFNVIKKRAEFRTAEGSTVSENEVVNLAAVNHMSTGNVLTFAHEAAHRNPYNPVERWIRSKPWDQTDRLPQLYATVRQEEGYPEELKQSLLHRWLLSAVAAALQSKGYHGRGVLTLQGAQGIGKTSWGRALISDPNLREEVFKTDHHLDGANKDSILGAISHWITEIGELDSSFKKDVARLKGFLTSDYDKLRPPYARSAIEYPRRTVFLATVNDSNFLVDTTGNSRWWTIALESLDFRHAIDMQQVFAQLAAEFETENAQWWLTREEEAALEQQNRKHLSVSAIKERILDEYEAAEPGDRDGFFVTPMELLTQIGFRMASNSQCKEAAAVLREMAGKSRRVHGRDRWRVKPTTREQFTRVPTLDASLPTDAEGEAF